MVSCLASLASQHLAGDGIHYEPRWFKPWPVGEVCDVNVGGTRYPVGDLLFDCGDVKIGLEICRDAWVTDRPGKRLAARGADIILNPSASHFAFDKQEIRRGIRAARFTRLHVSYAYSNLLGNESGRAIFDGGSLIASEGKMLAVGPRLSFADRTLTTADVDTEATRLLRNTVSPHQGAHDAHAGATITADFSFPKLQASLEPTQPLKWDISPPPKAEEFARAVPLALYDYLRKSRAGGMVVSLSGGADSSAVVTMIWLMVELGVAELGQKKFLEKLSHIPQLSQADSNQEIVRRLLTCIYQATRNSGPVTRDAANSIADAVGAEFLEWNIDALVDGYVDTVSQAVGRQLTWTQDDVALQNIQARARGPGAWLLANLRGALLLATSNRSEAAVGYATMDGDTCGGLAPITGIDKAYLLQWLEWMQQAGPEEVGSLSALSVINASSRLPNCDHPRSSKPTKAISCPIRCSMRSNVPRYATSRCQSKSGKRSADNSSSTTRNNSASGSNASSNSGAVISRSANAMLRRSISTMKTLTRKPGADSQSCQAGLKKELAELNRLLDEFKPAD